MRITLITFIAIHGIIHLFGFFKAFDIAEFEAMAEPISMTYGVFWLLTFLLFTTTIISMCVRSNYWWLIAFVTAIISQVLILSYWPDAKFGTIPNVIILLASIQGYSSFNFKKKIKEEKIALFEKSQFTGQGTIAETELTELPPIVQKWLRTSGAKDKGRLGTVRLTQELKLKLKPDQTNWYNGRAEQYFSLQPPAFHWTIDTEMNAVMHAVGRDKFEAGKGEMTIRLFSLIPVANAKNNEKVDQATLQRYLAEIVWFPSASLSEYIQWESLDAYSAKATMEYKGTKGSGVFHFNENGAFEKFEAMRFKDAKDVEPIRWTVSASKTEERDGIKIPVECEAHWELESGTWTWLKLSIAEIQYNVTEASAAKNSKNK